jgi:DNA-binding CsgD family transcriptional regulator
MDAATVSVLMRGLEGDLQALLPGLRSTSAPDRGSDTDLRTRLHWNLLQFVKRLTARSPLLLIFDNAQFCDPSSLEIAHFLARQIREIPMLLVIAYASDEADAAPQLGSIERSLLVMKAAVLQEVQALTAHDVTTLLQRLFAIDLTSAQKHGSALHRHTAGNAFFLEEALKVLLQTDVIRKADDVWIVGDVAELTLPPTARDTIAARLSTISDDARRLAEISAVGGARTRLEILEDVARLEPARFADAIDELCGRRILVEDESTATTHYEFVHPIVQSAVLGMLTAPRTRALHTSIGEALIRLYGDDAIVHAAEIAVHLVPGSSLGSRQRDLEFLTTAGRDALRRRADREAAQWLAEALQIADKREPALPRAELRDLVEGLATARRRVGEDTSDLLLRALELSQSDGAAQSRILRVMGAAAVTRGQTSEALQFFDRAESVARAADRLDLAIRTRVTAGLTLQSLGRSQDAKRTLQEILPTAESLGDEALLGRVHRVLLQLYALSGDAAKARAHGERALAHATASGDKVVAWAAHFAMATLAGFTGDRQGVDRHREQATNLADELRSPALQASTAELAIEYASAVGDWSEGLALAERTIPIARAIAPRTLLPRLLVWTGLMVLARDEVDRARALLNEAWQLARAHEVDETESLHVSDLGNVHNIIVAHTGQAALHLALRGWRRAVELCDRGVALADRFGFVVWSIHRLLPIQAEALLWLQEFDRVEVIGRRLREQSGALEHRLGLASATAIDALIMRFKHASPDAAARLLAAADELDAIPFVFHGARLRRNAAQLLAADGQTAAAIRELRVAHDTFARLGSEFELRGTRSELRSLGVRLPPRNPSAGAGMLTGRELEIARCVANRLSNKEIARALDISARTVSTHLSHIFEKLGVDSRGALADLVRSSPYLSEQ